MRRFLILIGVALCLLQDADAQSRWSVIPTAGVQVSNAKIDGKYHGDGYWGYKAGALIRYRTRNGVLGRLSLESGVMASLRGTMGNPNFEVSAHYLEIPLLLHFDINMTQFVNTFFKVGPYFSYALNSTFPDSNQTNQASKGFCPYDYGVELGIGAEYRRFVLSLGTNLGTYDFAIPEEIKAKHITGHLTLGYRF